MVNRPGLRDPNVTLLLYACSLLSADGVSDSKLDIAICKLIEPWSCLSLWHDHQSDSGLRGHRQVYRTFIHDELRCV